LYYKKNSLKNALKAFLVIDELKPITRHNLPHSKAINSITLLLMDEKLCNPLVNGCKFKN
jgi:hypothetical protein